MRLIHIADVHLDSAFATRRGEARRRLRQATFDAFRRCVELALAERVDALLIAGDLFDGQRLSFATEFRLLAEMRRLETEGIQVVYAAGNHDPGCAAAGRSLAWPRNVTVAAGDGPVVVAVAGRSGRTVGHVAAIGHADASVTDDLSRRLVPVGGSDLPQAALLHTQVRSSVGSAGHHPYAPSTLEKLRGVGFDYWALGHVHQREELSADPPVHYPGSLQGRGGRETGPRGALLVDLSVRGQPTVEFRELSPIRWEPLESPDLASAGTVEELAADLETAWRRARAEDRGGAETEWMAAITLAGASPLWRELADPDERAVLADEVANRIGALGCEVDARRVHPPAVVEDHAGRQDVLGAALDLAGRVRSGQERLGIAEGELAGFDRGRDDTVDQYVGRLLEGAEEELLVRMLVSGR